MRVDADKSLFAGGIEPGTFHEIRRVKCEGTVGIAFIVYITIKGASAFRFRSRCGSRSLG